MLTTPRRRLGWAAAQPQSSSWPLAWSGTAAATHTAGTFYTQTNDPAGNRVQLVHLRGGTPEARSASRRAASAPAAG